MNVVTLTRYEKRDVRDCIRPVCRESTWIRYTQNEDGLKCFGLGALFHRSYWKVIIFNYLTVHSQ